MDEYITKENAEAMKFKPRKEKEANAYQDARFQLMQNNLSLQTSTFDWRRNQKDSQSMIAVKEAMQDITDFMEREIPLEEEAFEKDAQELHSFAVTYVRL